MRMTVKMSKQFQGERNQGCSMAEKSSNSKRRDIFAIHCYKIRIILPIHNKKYIFLIFIVARCK